MWLPVDAKRLSTDPQIKAKFSRVANVTCHAAVVDATYSRDPSGDAPFIPARQNQVTLEDQAQLTPSQTIYCGRPKTSSHLSGLRFASDSAPGTITTRKRRTPAD